MVRCLKTPELGSYDYPKNFENVDWGGEVGTYTICPFDDTAWCRTGMAGFGVHVKGKGWLPG